MKEERNIITMDERGNISLPSDIGATAMTEREICEYRLEVATAMTALSVGKSANRSGRQKSAGHY